MTKQQQTYKFSLYKKFAFNLKQKNSARQESECEIEENTILLAKTQANNNNNIEIKLQI